MLNLCWGLGANVFWQMFQSTHIRIDKNEVIISALIEVCITYQSIKLSKTIDKNKNSKNNPSN